jgi:hypothetical protein
MEGGALVAKDPNVDSAAIQRAESERLKRLAKEIADAAEADRIAREKKGQ